MKLPKLVKKADLKYRYDKKNHLTNSHFEKLKEIGLPWESGFELWLVGDQWMIPTLTIKAAGRHGCRRSYCIGVNDRKVYTAGQGPHILEQLRVRLNRANFHRLLPMLELLVEGRKKANSIRDRTSTRRARGQLFRAAGRTHWRWSESDPIDPTLPQNVFSIRKRGSK